MSRRRYTRLKTSAAVAILAIGLGGGVVASQATTTDHEVVASPSVSSTPMPPPTYSQPLPTATLKQSALPAPQLARVNPAPPIRVEIPSARIDYPVVELPQESITDTPTGALINPPLNPGYVYWMTAGGMPGEKLATYLTAHSSSDTSRWPLDEISNESLVKINDTVLITTKNGTLKYVITELLSVSRADFATGKYGMPPKEDMIVIASCNTLDLYQQTRVLVAKRVE